MEQLKQTLHELKEDQPAYVSVTYGAGGTTRNRTVEITKWIKQELGVEAMAHLSCVGEPVEGLRAILDADARRGHRERARPARRPAARRDRVEAASRRPQLLHRAGQADRRELRLRDRRRLLPGGPPGGARHGARPQVPQGQGGVRGRLPDHPALLRQRSSTSTSSRRLARPASACRSCRASCRSRTSARSSASPRCAGPTIPESFEHELAARADDPSALTELGVAYATLQCADLLPAARRASTSTR